MLYITNAKIPSRWAHSFQVMKMAQAFSQVGWDAELTTTCSLMKWFDRDLQSVWEHYGISTPFKITKIPFGRWFLSHPGLSPKRVSYEYIAAWLAKKKGTDVIYSRNYSAPYWTTQMGIPTLAETHAEPEITFPKKALIQASRQEHFKALVTISSHLADQYVKLGVPEKKILIEPDGADLEGFLSGNFNEIEKIKKRLCGDRKTLVVYSGHLYDHKGIPLILEIAKKIPEASFVLIGGWDEDVARVRENAKDIPNIQLLGFISNKSLPLYLKAADILLLPNSRKHFQAGTTSPLKLFEYMASGKPIVASSLSNISSILTDKKNSLLVDPDNVIGFINAVQLLMENDLMGIILGQQAQKEVEKFSWKERVRRIIKFADI